jgi:hypothetical protein
MRGLSQFFLNIQPDLPEIPSAFTSSTAAPLIINKIQPSASDTYSVLPERLNRPPSSLRDRSQWLLRKSGADGAAFVCHLIDPYEPAVIESA